MHTPTEKAGFFQSVESANTAVLRSPSSGSAESWPAPTRKPNTLVLKRPSGGSASPLPEPGHSFASSSVAPFPIPGQESAFTVPRPVVVPGASSPWTPPAQKSDALVLPRSEGSRAGVEFTRPPFFAEKRSARHPWKICRSC